MLYIIILQNQSREERSIKVTMISNSMFYTGSKAHQVKHGDGDFVLQPYERETLTMTVQPEEYMPKTVEYCHFLNRFVVKVRQTDQVWTGEDNFILEKPKLDIRMIPEMPRAHRPAKVFIRFVNPLDMELSGCSFNLEAPGILMAQAKQKFRNIKAKEKVDFDIEATPTRSGQTTIVVRFSNCFEWPMMTMILINHIFSRQSSIPMSCRISLVLGKCQSSLDKEEITFISNLTALPSHHHAHLIEK